MLPVPFFVRLTMAPVFRSFVVVEYRFPHLALRFVLRELPRVKHGRGGGGHDRLCFPETRWAVERGKRIIYTTKYNSEGVAALSD